MAHPLLSGAHRSHARTARWSAHRTTPNNLSIHMKLIHSVRTRIDKARRLHQEGKFTTGLAFWLLGVPLPIILLVWLFKSCV